MNETDRKVTIEHIKREISKFGEERDWAKYHTPKNLSISISIEAAELLENFQWLKDNEIEKMLRNKETLKAIESEIADVMIYALNLSNRLGTDISRVILEKIKESREKYPIDKIKGNYKKYTEIK